LTATRIITIVENASADARSSGVEIAVLIENQIIIEDINSSPAIGPIE
jgi:hypothetical protein